MKTMIPTKKTTSCSGGYTIRPAAAVDFEPLFHLHHLTHGRFALSEDRLRRYLSMPSTGLGAIAALQGRYFRGYLLYQTNLPHTRLVDVVVAPAHRRKGIGSMLVLALLKDHPHASALVRERNVPAQLLLKHVGFKCLAVKPRKFGIDCDGYLFQR